MAAFDKAEYSRIQSQLKFRPALLPTLGVLLFDLALVCAIVFLLRAQSWPEYLAAQLLIPLLCFHNFSLLHECGHGVATRSRVLNTLIGHYASVFCFIPFFPWKYIHQQHHAWGGNLENDPVLKSLRTFRDRGTPMLARAGWRSWIPVGAFLQHIVYLSYPLQLARTGELPRSRLLRCAGSLLWMAGAWSALFALAPDLAHPRSWAFGVALFFMSEELVNLPHHVGMPTHGTKLPSWEQYRFTRSCYYPAGVSELLVLNFNFHVEHHLFPSLPWYRLRDARRRLKPALDHDYCEAIGAEWNVRNRQRGLDEIVDLYRANSSAPQS
jgi:acyl-lipid omega-6 desaturase (Delta-12 desaturase)